MKCDICNLEGTAENTKKVGGFHRMDEFSWRCLPCIQSTPKRVRVAQQVFQATKHSVTCNCGKTLALRFAYRCLYCGEYYCQKCAEAHFGQTREEYDAERAHKEQTIQSMKTTTTRPTEQEEKLTELYRRFDILEGTAQEKNTVLQKFIGPREFHCSGEAELSQEEYDRLALLANEEIYLLEH